MTPRPVNARPTFRTHTPVEVLEGNLVLPYDDSAYVLGLLITRGAREGLPDTRRIAALVTSGQLAVVDDRAPERHRRIATSALRAYLAGDRRTIRRAG